MTFLSWASEHPWFTAFMALMALALIKDCANFILHLFKREEME